MCASRVRSQPRGETRGLISNTLARTSGGDALKEIVVRGVIVLAVASLLATRAGAQEIAGSVQGAVLDSAGRPLPGAQVIATSPSLQGERHAAADSRGRFLLRSLPGGSYSIAIRFLGYGPVRFDGVVVRLGVTTSMGDIRLEARPIGLAEVVVSGAKPAIDPTSAASGVTLDSSQFLSLPSDRSFQSLMRYVPQANESAYGDGINVGGSTGLENAFFVDGIDVMVGAGTSVAVPFNFVQQIQVITGGYDAEHGRALSGVVNVVTPSGGNEFHGQLLAYYTSGALRSPPKVGIYETDVSDFGHYDLGFIVSGPIRRDRLWFSIAYDPTVERSLESIGLLDPHWDASVNHLFAGKLTWGAAPETNLTLTVLGDPGYRNGVESVLPMTVDSAAALSRYTSGSAAIGLALQHEISPRILLQVAASHLRRVDAKYSRAGADSLSLVQLNDYTTHMSSGGIGFQHDIVETRTAVRTAVTVLGAAHTIRVGAEFETNEYGGSTQYSVITREADTLYDWNQGSVSGTVANRIPTLFVQDSWEVARQLQLNAGIRWESQHMSGEGPARTVPSEPAVRLGLVFQPGESGRARIFASAGRFYEQVPPLSAQWWNGRGYILERLFPLDPRVDSSRADTLQHATYPLAASPDMLGQSYDQFIVGYERVFDGGYRVGIGGTYRTLNWVIDDGTLPGETIYRVGNPGLGLLSAMPRAQQRYEALTLTIERAAPGPLYLLASYVLSRNVGNYTGLYSTDNGYGLANAGSTYDVPDAMTNAYGLLPNDRTHVLKTSAVYHLSTRATLGGFLTVASGTPLSKGGQSAYGTYFTFVDPRGSVGRTPAIWSLDLHGSVDLSVTASQRVRPSLLIDVFNVGSPRAPVTYDQQYYLTADRTKVNSSYGSVTGYQPPMSARVGMAIDF